MGAPSTASKGLGPGRGSLGIRFLLLAIISCTLMVLDRRTPHVEPIRQTFSFVVYPVQLLVDAPPRAWRWAVESLAERSSLLAENEQLKREQLHANARLQRLAALEAENRRLRELLDSTSRITDRVLVAEILAVDLDPYRQRFNVNRGALDGAYVGQALLDANGVVGQLVNVAPMTAEAVLITDADHAVPVIVNRNGLRTIAVGTGDSGRLRLPYLTNSADIQVDDLLLSSGLGGVFPAGYPVGRVTEVRRRPGQSFADVIAEPAAALDRDREVLLVWTGDDDLDTLAGFGADPAQDAGLDGDGNASLSFETTRLSAPSGAAPGRAAGAADDLHGAVGPAAETEQRLTRSAEQRLAESEQQLAESEQRLTESEQRLTESEQRLTESEQRLTESEPRLADPAEQRLAQSAEQAVAEAQR